MPRRFINKQTLSGLDAPVMYQGGTRDIGITPFINKGNGAIHKVPHPKVLRRVRWRGTFRLDRPQPEISVRDNRLQPRAFSINILKGKSFPAALATLHPGVTVVEIKE